LIVERRYTFQRALCATRADVPSNHEVNMSKGMDQKKTDKKAPLKTAKEKKEAKQEKKKKS
jgi:hypothetical protein